MMTPEDRYMSDPVFHRLVDVMYNEIVKAEVTPSELREASILACIRYELRRPTPTFAQLEQQVEEEYKRLKREL